MKATNKRLVSILLCLAMVLAILPMAVFAAGTTIYCDAPDSWTACYVHYWGGASSSNWPGDAMTLGEDGIWYAEVPADSTGIIFHNGNGTQTSDLTMPTDDNVQYNYEAGTWSTYGAVVEVPETVYYLRGSMNSWVADETNAMTNNGDGTYTITMDLAAGSYEFKAAVADWSWSCPSGSNMTLTLDADDTVTFTLDVNANTLTYTLASGTVVEVSYYLMGTMNEWTANDASKMTKQDDGTYAITLALEAGDYEYKAALADWSWSCPGSDNATVTVSTACDVTFVLDVANNTVTATGDGVQEADPVVYNYYVAGDEGLTGYTWDPAQNQMTLDETTGLYTITFEVNTAGTYEYKITTGSWETPSYGYGEGNYSVTVKNPGTVTITFNAETTEVGCTVKEFGASELKFQLNADATAASETVDLRMITSVDSLAYSSVVFYITIGDQTATWECDTVYTAINANDSSLTCEDIFGTEGYLVTFTLANVPAEYYGSDISVYAEFTPVDGEVWSTNSRTIVLSDILA